MKMLFTLGLTWYNAIAFAAMDTHESLFAAVAFPLISMGFFMAALALTKQYFKQ